MKPNNPRGITIGTLGVALTAMAIILVLALIKIYLSNRIYMQSRHVHFLEQQVAALKEENLMLQMRVEKLRYKNQIADTIFTLEDDPLPEDDNPPSEADTE
jgi:hypothetical protein